MLQSRGEPLPEDLAVELIAPEEVAEVVVDLIVDDALAGRVVLLKGGRPPRLLPNEAFA